MKNEIYPCLWFDGQAKAAAEFYCSVFNNSRITTDTPLVVNFELEGKKFMGLNGGANFKMNPAISAFVTCETPEETNRIWGKLIEGGMALIDIDKQAWSERYGWLQDKYGFTWQISVVGAPGEKAQIRPSMLFTNKQFGRAEEAIKFYTSVFDNSSIDLLLHYAEGDANAGKVLYSQFNLKGHDMIAMDGPGVHDYNFDWGVSMFVNCETQEEIDYYWKSLSEGGEESNCGWLRDKFGVWWQIVPAILDKLMKDPVKAQRVMQEVLKMKKLDMERMVNA
jgi:predicted 3-demethylubiquinone-9 3-methyltransferase (glyoxalase superfamily)